MPAGIAGKAIPVWVSITFTKVKVFAGPLVKQSLVSLNFRGKTSLSWWEIGWRSTFLWESFSGHFLRSEFKELAENCLPKRNFRTAKIVRHSNLLHCRTISDVHFFLQAYNTSPDSSAHVGKKNYVMVLQILHMKLKTILDTMFIHSTMHELLMHCFSMFGNRVRNGILVLDKL